MDTRAHGDASAGEKENATGRPWLCQVVKAGQFIELWRDVIARTPCYHRLVPGDGDSSLGDDTASSTQSVSSSIVDYRRENDRTYHRYKDGKYNFPNDNQESDRLDLQHHLFLLTFDNKLGLAPPNRPGAKVETVLDVGTGTGVWAMDYGDEHPEAKV
ncbi:hypothetical protein AUP68_16787 [Ilyonectria robusta]